MDIGYTGTVSPTVDWAESSCPPPVCDGMIFCLQLAMLEMSHVYCSSLLERKQLSYDFLCWLLASQHVLADGDVAVPSGREASTVIKQLSSVSVSTGICPPAISPTYGARIVLLQVYHPIWEGWFMHWAHGSGQTNQQTCLI